MNDSRKFTPGVDARRATILIVDDDASNLAVVSEYLRDENLEVLVAEDGQMGLARAGLARPDLILLDVLMPEMDGFETCRRLQADDATRDIPVIFMTALTDTENKMRGFSAGAVDYLSKPSHREEVLARVRVHLRIRELNENLKKANALLESRVKERTAKLAGANRALQAEIAERRQAEEEVAKAKDFLDKIINCIGDPIFVKDRMHKWILVNDALCRFLGQSRERILGKTSEDLFPKEQVEVFREKDEDIFAGGEENINEEQFTDANGDMHTILTKKTLYRDDRGERYIVGIFSDITERKNLEAQLRQAVKMEAIGTLAGGVAHDFNNLMTAVTGYSALLLGRLPPGDPSRKDIEQIQRAGLRAASLTGQLLAFSRKQIVQPKVLDLNKVVNDTENMLRRLIGEDIELITQTDPALWRVMADPGLIEQVIINLAINARDAMPRGGKLAIEAHNIHLDEGYARKHMAIKPGPHVLLAISDNGIGMDADTLSHIFEPFFTTKEKGKGTGLGLATVYGIVKQSGGSIWVYSEPRRGTTFKVYLPRAEEEIPTSEQENESLELVGGCETILLVEDDDIVRDLTGASLRLCGYTVFEAANGSEALSFCRDCHDAIDLLVTDVVMPGMDGRQVAQAIKALNSAIKVLFISGYTDNAIVHHGVLEKGIEFLQKPFTPQLLTSKVRKVLDKLPS